MFRGCLRRVYGMFRMFSGCLADVYGMFRGCLGFRRRTDSQRNSDTEYQSEQKPPLACLGVVKAMFSGCLADLYRMFPGCLKGV